MSIRSCLTSPTTWNQGRRSVTPIPPAACDDGDENTMRWRRSRCSGREHVVIIRPTREGMVLHTMYYEDELHKANQPSLPKEEKYTQKEIELAKRLIDTLASPFKLDEYHDTYRENVLKMIDQKQKGHEVTPIRQPRVAP